MPNGGSETYDVVIKVTGAHLTVDPTSLHVRRQDRVSWRCEQGGFLVSFKGHSPFNVVNIRSVTGAATEPRPFRADATPAAYHYAVAVAQAVSGGAAVTMTAGCPEIIVDGI